MMPPDLWPLVKSIPVGKVASYGQVGSLLENPASGFMVGRWMANCPEDIPWWRVVAKDGSLPVWKMDANLERLQIDHLEREGVTVSDGKVPMKHFRWDPDQPIA